MKIARLSMQQGYRYAIYDPDADDYIVLADDPLFAREVKPTGQRVAKADAELVAPMLPRTKVFGFGGTYRQGATAADLSTFLKPSTSVTGPEDPIMVPQWAPGLVHEAEIAVVIAHPLKDATAAQARKAILGYTVIDDLTVTGVGPAQAKYWDSSLPLGPVIETDFDYQQARITSRVNGNLVTDVQAADLAFSPEELVAIASQHTSLLPGDIVLTGTGTANGEVTHQDVVEVTVEGIGTIRNQIFAPHLAPQAN
ncbi:2-keto-4-pentenoate hydratase/2-oxohepta-3-ene-1,7-dioic acid hydratase (catechol pathway) [Actinobaculum suis]|uniref:2-keto-4-pentenoate hydratase/2-oxohepta-3-ene-1,7-dioic acid hydratase (Catechol pathway) n=1 Tax=Actinobaculum suis TaxID=1657 RepID=A0A0K9EUH3_9ACTO|nr:fumarylacetoacetate hydrolase family protein [Actinobaculum suis]KMY23520.1 2-hydroxyhepta-2,4-diene-1,7-dioate isomerase [Actinobaculum suis]MDY5153305.1 fumarylacetoacetate hydrolase family protein [Actinobaculum suis]OCA96033.1 2-hydroxyhepta-2,4-diene-1,7-dioate isomerase [Actinobaculum suis]OCA96152.1 2-hydroxyhepta-2,4-diene-1,7-dioate isomerase [Actinobaculum suis]SDE47258.1 2-keto-4-pentenoate hydratase/2-oxohepta-3-ene-1,7-dioic acid hydratase (catechol pathway) [Actinobaculum suis